MVALPSTTKVAEQQTSPILTVYFAASSKAVLIIHSVWVECFQPISKCSSSGLISFPSLNHLTCLLERGFESWHENTVECSSTTRWSCKGRVKAIGDSERDITPHVVHKIYITFQLKMNTVLLHLHVWSEIVMCCRVLYDWKLLKWERGEVN